MRGPGLYKPAPRSPPAQHATVSSCVELYPPIHSLKHSVRMVKHFSVDWMAQSSTSSKRIDGHMDLTSPVRPHVRCMVQPRQPSSYGKDYLQPKPKSFKTAERTIPNEYIPLASPARSTTCVSPSKLIFCFISNQNISRSLFFCYLCVCVCVCAELANADF